MARVQVIDSNGKDLGKLEAKIYSQIGGIPYRVDYDGEEYWATGKTGESRITGKTVVEMATAEDCRLWVNIGETLITLD